MAQNCHNGGNKGYVVFGVGIVSVARKIRVQYGGLILPCDGENSVVKWY
jgi:hypothetical protein